MEKPAENGSFIGRLYERLTGRESCRKRVARAERNLLEATEKLMIKIGDGKVTNDRDFAG